MPQTPACILVIDDEPELQRLIERRLKHQIEIGEFQFLFTTSGIDALDILRSTPHISMVLTDLNMPGMDGWALLEQIPKIDPLLKAVVVSAYGDIQNIRTAMNRGAFDFLTKPINFQDLILTIRKTIDIVTKSRLQKEQLEAAVENLQYLALYDKLTGLPNQNHVLECIRAAIDQRLDFAVFYLALDRFKVIRYGYGKTLAEEFLIQAVERIKSCLHTTDVLARIWKDEFVLFLPGIQSENIALERANQIHKALKLSLRGHRIIASGNTSIGIALSSFPCEQAEDFLRVADTAMHYARMQNQKNCTVFFNPEMQMAVLNRLQLESDLELGLENQEFRVYYQPIYSLDNQHLAGFEALVRWQHPSRGLIPPSEFIPLTEETGLIIPLGEWVLREACRQFSRWYKEFPEQFPLILSVNLSGLQILNSDFTSLIDNIIQSNPLEGFTLKLEITESILMENPEIVTQYMSQFQSRKIRLAIDDFGTGYSCLSYLQSLPLDTLKIDRSFISNLNLNPKSLDIIKTLITLAHSLNLDVIAEGVETEQQIAILKDLGCEYAQGYYFSPPVDANCIFRLFQKKKVY
ncbi:putative signaling protein PA1727 [Planktothrix tepida]|uniref:Signaling protein PA1727 n=2 Tax=Planktothrix TaxID=54304 RepID=A0A9W4CES3_9CYAN|nr:MULTISPECIES: EAL domain-containing response regulator [Planktothrix]CAD5918696.1 putative signaling protein PA1727 [Planktothrix pseudagardhii]CAD5982088.1 putative signaling protein PA1727 [Planktothrix tepida]CUR35737.1 putative Response regulator receiver modulated diguanylate cyclase/phosphodiesterase [Planktothrix tepida PCC 9214]